jgi:hypothetical protein
MDYGAIEREIMNSGVEQIRPYLEARQFEYSSGEQGVASAGPFAVASFRRRCLQLGLIVRQGSGLGCPNYSDGTFYVGHHDLIASLNADGREKLVEGTWPSFTARHGGDAFEALRDDLDSIILPALDVSEATFIELLGRAYERRRLRSSWL